MKKSILFILALVALSSFRIESKSSRSTDSMEGVFNVKAYHAKGDGTTDDTRAIQAALDAAGKAGGGIVNVPTGQYRINGNLVIPAGVTLQGTFRVPPSDNKKDPQNLCGTVMLAYAGRGKPGDKPFIRLGGNMSTLAGVIITYPDWKQTDVPPIPYPPAVLAEGGIVNVGVIDCCFLNTYEAIRLISAHRHLIRNVCGYPHWRGIYVDACGDVGRIENCHFWPFGVKYKPDDPFCKWTNTHAVAFEFARTDWQYVLNTFCFGYGVGYKFSESEHGSCNGNFLGIGADCCERAVLVEQAQPFGLLITNGEFVGRWSSKEAICVEIGEKVNSKISLTNCAFWGPIARIIVQKGPKAQLTANACHFENWDKAAIQVDEGKAIIQGNTFMKKKLAIIVGPKVVSAIITSNQATGGLNVQNEAGDRTQMGFNELPVIVNK
ncbi:MAG: glycoside hydrolase family 55 protein [Bacteroidetes bacterium]|nr:glycoside hydrolase family 55 protein [Bacteroidota bacterium]